MQYEEIPKHHKKKQSSTSSANKKSKHKHLYKECLLVNDGKPHRAEYCSICGKVGNLHFFESEKTEEGCYRQLNYDEVYEKFSECEKIPVEDIFQRYIPTSENYATQR